MTSKNQHTKMFYGRQDHKHDDEHTQADCAFVEPTNSQAKRNLLKHTTGKIRFGGDLSPNSFDSGCGNSYCSTGSEILSTGSEARSSESENSLDPPSSGHTMLHGYINKDKESINKKPLVNDFKTIMEVDEKLQKMALSSNDRVDGCSETLFRLSTQIDSKLKQGEVSGEDEGYITQSIPSTYFKSTPDSVSNVVRNLLQGSKTTINKVPRGDNVHCMDTFSAIGDCTSTSDCSPPHAGNSLDASVLSHLVTKQEVKKWFCSPGNKIVRKPGSENVVKYYTPDNDGDNQLFVAIMNFDTPAAISIINMALHFSHLNQANYLRQTALILAVVSNLPRVIRRLMVGGARVDAIDCHGNTPLHIACMYAYVASAKHLTTPTHRTEMKVNRYNVPFQLIPQNTEAANCDGYCCIHLAAQHYLTHGHFEALEVIQILVRSGANINVQERKSGKTILHMGAESGDKDFLTFLMSLPRVDLEAETFAGHTALYLAFSRGHRYVVSQLEKFGADTSVIEYSDTEDDMSEDEDATNMMDES